MFAPKDIRLFVLSGLLLTAGFLCMLLDTTPNGFGMLTLTVAPLLLLTGFALPIVAIMGIDHLRSFFTRGRFRTGIQRHLVGVAIFVVTLAAYVMTLEPTASLWDCGEFIASAYKLQVPHTPGAPLTLLVGRLFTMLSFGDVQQVAWCMNLMSAVFSALSVFIVYHIIFISSESILRKSEGTTNKFISILAGVCGSLSMAFCDTFWFSAVEAETYGIACFFLLSILFLIIKGNDAVEPLRSRYLVLIAYLTALSYCIHPMCVLILPVLTFLWYSRKLSIKTIVFSTFAGLVIVFAINRFVAIGLFELAFNLDLLFVNFLGMPFYTGAIALLTLMIVLFMWVIRRFRTHQVYTWSVVFLLLGFLPYLMLFIRSNHNPPIDETNPENLAMIKAYMNRESYPTSPLLTGPYFDAQITDVVNTKKAYYKGESEYKVAGSLINYKYDNNRVTILPRMYSREDSHMAAYRRWTGLGPKETPGFVENISFMLTYQLGHMYLRYVMWNFVGRESDVQNSAWLKPWESLAGKNDSKARNQYWMLPLALGLCGVVVQCASDKRYFFVNLIFFLMTGLILALYLNSPPVEPRERDYIYVASYVAFCIWIGLGLLVFRQSFLSEKIQRVIIVLIGLAVPAWMCYQNLDDHDRSGRTFQMDYAREILNSCAPNAILFTGGDNDTFPLWYLQDVEGVRTDVRIAVLSYFNTDWYINQLRNQYYDSKPFKLTLTEKEYRQYGLNDVLYVEEQVKNPIDVNKYLRLLKEGHPALTRYTNNGDSYNIIPSHHLKVVIGEDTPVFKTTGLSASRELNLKITGNYLQKNALAVLDVLVSNQGERPLYFNYTSMNTLGLDVSKYLVNEGLLYRLTTHENSSSEIPVDTEAAFKNLITNGDYSNLRQDKVFFHHEDFQLRMISPLRQDFNALTAAYLKNGNTSRAKEVIIYAADNLYFPHLETSYSDVYAADLLWSVQEKERAKLIATRYVEKNIGLWRERVSEGKLPDHSDVYFMTQAAQLLAEMGEKKYVAEIERLL